MPGRTKAQGFPVKRHVGDRDPENKPLTQQQRLFVVNLVHHRMSQTAAARLAGYEQPNTAAYQVMRSPAVKKAIAEERAEYARASQITKKQVLDGMLEAIQAARVVSDPATMVRGWREVGLICGHYAPTVKKIDVTHKGEVMLGKLQQMTDTELLELAESSDPNIIDGEFELLEDDPGSLELDE